MITVDFKNLFFKVESLDKTKILIGLESAHYGENIISYLFNLDFNIELIIIQFRPLIFVGLISEKLRI